MNVLIRLVVVSVCTLAAGCGGGGDGNNGSAMVGRATMPAPVPTPTPVDGTPSTPQSVSDVQGLYVGRAVDSQDPNNILDVQALITADGKALIYIEDDSGNSSVLLPLAVIDGQLVASGDEVALTEATAFVVDQSPVTVSGRLQLDTDLNDDIDLLAELMIGGRTVDVELGSFDDEYRMPSSLQAVAGNYGFGIGTDSTLMIDTAGNVILTQDATTGCSGTGRVTVDIPAVNAYALSLQLMGCVDPNQNGTYAGRLSRVGTVLGLFAHSSMMPLFDPSFEEI